MSDMAIEPKQRKISVTEYHRMAEAGILCEGERVELLDGIIFEMSPLGRLHVVLHTRIVRYLTLRLGQRGSVSGQISVRLGDLNEPQPDIVILAPDAAERVDRYPAIDEMYAFIEISGSSLKWDSGRKRDLYALYGIGEYLVVDVEHAVLLRHTDPTEGRYRRVEELSHDDAFSLNALPDLALEVRSFLPPLG